MDRYQDTRLPDLILDSMELGLNKKLLLLAIGIDEDTFNYQLEYDKFSAEDARKLRRAIRDWRKANAIF